MTAVDTCVVREDGLWVVYLVRMDNDGVHTERLRAFSVQRQAELLADLTRRAAYRRASAADSGRTP